MSGYSESEIRTMYRDAFDKEIWLRDIGPCLACRTENQLRDMFGLTRRKGKRNSKCQWSQEEIEYLFKHKNDSIKDIAKALNKSQNSVLSQRGRLNIQRTNKWNDERKGELLRLYKSGMKLAGIAKHFGVEEHAVAMQLTKLRKEGLLTYKRKGR